MKGTEAKPKETTKCRTEKMQELKLRHEHKKRRKGVEEKAHEDGGMVG